MPENCAWQSLLLVGAASSLAKWLYEGKHKYFFFPEFEVLGPSELNIFRLFTF